MRSTDRGGGAGHEYLLRAGYIRQSSAGIFSLLPLGLRVLAKLERRIDDCMSRLDAQKIALPTLTSRKLWEDSGRWTSTGKELFKVKDRKDAEFCLAPTHEEAITKLVAAEVNGYKQLPVRVYQTNRKFRDEMRPRGGMLRGKEFIMKDLYTFDDGSENARATYEEVSTVYKDLFESLEVPFHVAEADSGNIGGDLSHEYHIPSSVGEDTLLTCSCGYVANQELAQTQIEGETEVRLFCHPIYRDSVFFKAEVPVSRELNMLQFERQVRLADPTASTVLPISSVHPTKGKTVHHINASVLAQAEDPCPKCARSLHAEQAIEIGHTFYLGQKYSKEFKYSNKQNQSLSPEMGCHGIGVTRLIAALAEVLHDQHGLNWPKGLAPYENAIVVEPGLEQYAERAYDKLHDVVIDDRSRSVPFRVKELHLIGVPNVYVIGKRFLELGQNRDGTSFILEKASRGASQREFEQVVLD